MSGAPAGIAFPTPIDFPSSLPTLPTVPLSVPPAVPPPVPPPDAIPLDLRHGAVTSLEGDLVVVDAIHPAAVVNLKASRAGAVVLGFSTNNSEQHSIFDLRLGQLHYSRMLACARNKLWWMTPEWRTYGSGTVPPETQFLLLEKERDKGPYALLLPLIDGAFRATLRPVRPADRPGSGDVCLRIESGDSSVAGNQWESALYVAAGTDPYELIERGVAAAAELSGGARRRVDKVLPPIIENFGWCTWDAFYSTVSARGLHQGLQSLHDAGIRPGFVIIDDGWQMTDTDPPVLPTASELAGRLHMDRAKEILEDTEVDFYNEAQEVLGQAATRMIPPSSSAGRILQPAAEHMGPSMPHHHSHLHHHHRHHGDASHLETDASIPTTSSLSSMDSPLARTTTASSEPPRPFSSSQAAVQTEVQEGQRDEDGGVSESAPLLSPWKSGGSSGTVAATATIEMTVQGSVAAPAPAGQEAVQEEQAAVQAAGRTSKVAELAEREAIWVVRLAQKVAGAMAGAVSAAIVIFYQWVVEPAAPDSLAVRWFAAAAKGPLRGALLQLFAASSDFTRRLTSVRANGKFSGPDAAPDADWEDREERLGDVVTSIKQKYGVKHVYCWHGLPGYWAGVMPNSGAVQQYEPRIVFAEPTAGVQEVDPAMAWNPAVLAGVGVVDNPVDLYSDMHRYLAASNVDGVKVDCQAGAGLIGSKLGGGPTLSSRFQQALETSVARHFADNHCINCMCHSTENLYRMSNTVLVRASDDFYPRDPASSTPHVAACAFNSVFLAPMLHPDWDMFHSLHPAARMHAMARAISGGAVYISDKPGEHDVGLLRTLVLADGSILRAQLPGRPTRDCLFADVLRDGKTLLKVWNTNPCNAVVGVFHLQGSSWDRTKRKFHVHDKTPRPLTTQVTPKDVEPWRQAQEAVRTGRDGVPPAAQRYIVYSFTSGEMRLLGFDEGLPVSLAAGDSDMVTVAPVVEVGGTGSTAGCAFAPVGLTGMMNGGAAVTSCVSLGALEAAVGARPAELHVSQPGRKYAVGVRGCGTLLMYASRAPQGLTLAGAHLAFDYDDATGKLTVELPEIPGLTHELLLTI